MCRHHQEATEAVAAVDHLLHLQREASLHHQDHPVFHQDRLMEAVGMEAAAPPQKAMTTRESDLT